MTKPLVTPKDFTAEEKFLLSAAAPSIAAGLELAGHHVGSTVAAVVLVVERELMTVDFVEAGEEPEHFIRAVKAMAPADEGAYRERLAKAFDEPARGMLRMIVATPRGTVSMKLILGGSGQVPS